MNGLSEIGERPLVDLARRDRDAFAELYRRHVQAVHAFARRRTGSAADAEDVTAVTFERALRSLHRYDPARGSFIAWLYRIATNEIIDQARRRRRRDTPRNQAILHLVTTGEGADAADPAADTLLGAEGDGQLLAALDTLNTRYNTVLSLRFIAGLDVADVAAHLGVTPGNCAVLTHRALAALRRRLEKGHAS
ncbi:MAG: sigma-70 family RNA polymerase sigma factor [Ilumatobacter sp.]|nr:sigma-70 family RNA polymerase sigma factor [Ilumatobacter sp.]MCB0983465.1 sigma-70 family RNA polymerase sigma factor [Ilumatobacter sp.]